MKILLTGGGTAGHFYPLIAIVQEIAKISEEEKLVKPQFFFMSTNPYDKRALFDNDIEFRMIFAGKRRTYFSLLNVTDKIKTALGILKALLSVYLIYPDVIVSKGGYASVPAVFAGRLLRIPIIIHESDSVPGRANQWASRFAVRVAVSWPEAAEFFPPEKTAVTGQPLRAEIRKRTEGAHEYLQFDRNLPTILVLGGSQGARHINETILEILPALVSKYQVVHQAGERNLREVRELASVILKSEEEKKRYKVFGFLDALALRMGAGAAFLVVSRAGSTLFEIAAWGLPSILIPLSESQGDHQRKNAFFYARQGAAIVIHEKNLTPHVLLSEINRLIENEPLRREMGKAAEAFFDPLGGERIAREALRIALGHEK